ncbi:unnamed protein product [Onchocerca ochengi]|uniref:Ovule protein n=1 Tax=Onchocerca ochengi TaxID=42157 RepID=A0A182E1Q9_ONCOC|nr:unnamed protein product [Onchocerca ochengi]
MYLQHDGLTVLFHFTTTSLLYLVILANSSIFYSISWLLWRRLPNCFFHIFCIHQIALMFLDIFATMFRIFAALFVNSLKF